MTATRLPGNFTHTCILECAGCRAGRCVVLSIGTLRDGKADYYLLRGGAGCGRITTSVTVKLPAVGSARTAGELGLEGSASVADDLPPGPGGPHPSQRRTAFPEPASPGPGFRPDVVCAEVGVACCGRSAIWDTGERGARRG